MKTDTYLTVASVLLLAACSHSTPVEEAGADDGAGLVGLDAGLDITFERFTLENGLRVIVHTDRKVPIVNVNITYRVGSKDEPDGKAGFAHLFEHLMFNGSEHFDGEYFDVLEEAGANSLNGTTSFDRTNFFETVPTSALELTLWLESDRMGHLLGALTQAKLDEQRSVVQNEKRQGDNRPYAGAKDRQLKALFPPGHPYRHAPIGYMEDLNSASLEDVHDWFNTYYGATNAVVVLAGDIDVDTARSLMEKFFGDVRPGPDLARVEERIPGPYENRYDSMYSAVPQAHIYRNWSTPGITDRQTTLLELSAIVLGQGKNSRLHQRLVVEAGVATEAMAFIQPMELTSNFGFQIVLTDPSHEDEALRLVAEVLEKFFKDGPTPDELERINTLKVAGRVRSMERIGVKASLLASGEIYAADPTFHRKSLQWSLKASPEEIRQTAIRWLGERGYFQNIVRPRGHQAAVESTADRSILPAAEGISAINFPETQELRLKNGLRVIVAERHDVPLLNLIMQFDTGIAHDTTTMPGLADFVGSMMKEGTNTRTAETIEAELARVGAQLRVNVGMEHTVMSLSALTARLLPALEIFSDVLRNPAFDQTAIEQQRTARISSIEKAAVTPSSMGRNQLLQALYGSDHPYAVLNGGAGTVASIKQLAREDLLQFYGRGIRPENATLFVIGDTTAEEIIPALDAVLGRWQGDGEFVSPTPLGTVAERDGPRVILVHKAGLSQATVLVGQLVMPPSDEHSFAFENVNKIFGAGFGGRINMNLREDKGWSYGANSTIQNVAGARPWYINTRVQIDRTRDSLIEIQRELAAIAGDRPVTAAEYEATASGILKSAAGQFESSTAVLRSMINAHNLGYPLDHTTRIAERYAALTLDGVNRIAQQTLTPDNMVWVIVADLDRVEADIRALELGPVEVIR